MSKKIGRLLYTGKAKDVYETDDPDKVIVKFRDDITAGDGEKKDNIEMKGYYNSLISAKLFQVLKAEGIRTQYIELSKPRYMLSHRLEMIPLEVIARNKAAGSLLRRYPFEDGQEFVPPLIQIDYKSDEFGDPMLNDEIAIALGLVNREEIRKIKEITLKINNSLKKFMEERGISLVDFKIEFGFDKDRNIVLGDEISPDTCRFWDIETCAILDKDLFRKGESGVIEAYRKVALMLLDEEDKNKWGLE
ncbi:MAG: phosphoribosylaminoimidazolesuccinocarboxamide synthase [Methanobacteriaceae archaeon]|jgi:phosphoribosylaminoimidazole-succinocarboxamide synthase|nr:phosphoribosylaminoimidazolesuccinocarboxamide synthase [Methanobacteriaceae archaeon]